MNQHRPPRTSEYDADFYAWSQHQAKLLRALKGDAPGPVRDLDIDHLAEEIEDLGKADLRSVTSLIRQIFIHLLKAASEKDSQARLHWRAEATAFQADLPSFYTPSMRQLIDLDAIWRKAMAVADTALQEHGSSISKDIPATCPFALSDIVSGEFNFDAFLAHLQEAMRVAKSSAE